jgi:polyhydroxybutyrate depolymerase
MRLACVLVASLLVACGASPRPAAPVAKQCEAMPGDQRVDGVLLHVPPHAPLGLVLAFHGAGMTGQAMADYSGLSSAADPFGFAVLYPDAARGHFWSLNKKMGTRVIEALRALLPRVLAAACTDRIFATGVSNGGGFAARVGCELDVVAIAPVAGGYRALDPCHGRTSVLEIHGTADTVVPYQGKKPDFRGSVPRYLRGWARRDECSRAVTTHPRRFVTRVRYACPDGLVVEHLRLTGTDHGWPGSSPPFPSRNPSGVAANDEVLRFFARLAA